MKNTKRLLGILLCCMMLCCLLPAVAMAVDVPTAAPAVIPFELEWSGNDESVRPDKVTVYLKAGEETVATTKVSKPNWKGSFTVPAADCFNADGTMRTFTIVEEDLTNYDIGYTNPKPTVVPGPPADDDKTGWAKENSCSEKVHVLKNPGSTVLVFKKGQDFLLWSARELTDEEANDILDSVGDGTYNNISNPTVICGDNKSSNGITFDISDDGKTVTVKFDDSSKWSSYAAGASTAEVKTTTIIKNTYIPPETTSVTVNKVWEDANNQDGKRPDSVSVQLKVGGEASGAPVTLNAGNKWTYTWKDLAKFNEDGSEIVYTVDETAVPDGYQKSVDGFTITNSYTPETTSVTVNKVWEDNDDQDGKRPESVSVQLLADGTASGTAVTLNAEGEWKYTWNNLPVNKEGKAIVYTVDETAVPDGYQKSVDGFTITNSYTPKETSVTVTKVWDDAENKDNIRPESVSVQLYAGGKASGDPVTLNAGNEWTYTWEELPKYADGEEIEYTVDETEVPEGYEKTVTVAETGITITNKHIPEEVPPTPETTSVTVTKVWNHGNNPKEQQPTSVAVKLYADGTEAESAYIEQGEDGTWTYTWKDLAKFKEDGSEIVYTVDETAVPDGYQKSVDGFTITNTYTPETTSVTVTKVWDDNDDQAAKRPTSITVKLMLRGELTDKSLTLTRDTNWTGTFEGLEVTDGYSVEEVEVEGYRTSISGSAEDGFVITNTLVPEIVVVPNLPQTGDHSSLGLWAMLCAACLGALGLNARAKRKAE